MARSALVRYGTPAAVFATVLAGTVALAARGGPGPDRDTGAKRLEPLRLGARPGAAEADSRTSSSAMYAGGGAIVIPDRLLDGLPTEGPVHEVSGDVDPDRVAALARALNLVGPVESDAEGWRVRQGDRVLRVYRQQAAHWYYGPDKERAIAVAGSAEPESDPDKPVSSGDTPVSSEPCDEKECVEPAPAPCPKPPDGAEPACVVPEPTKPPQPSDAEARASAQRVFDAAGLTDAAITLNDAWSGKEVVAAPRVGGLPTVGFETRVTVELGGVVQYASGNLGTARFKADYPLLAPRDAVQRNAYGAPRADVAPAPWGPCPSGEACPTPEPREAKTLRLGLLIMPSYDAGQAAYLAPAWLMTFEGSDWAEPTLALPDQYVATPPPDAPRDAPAQDAPAQDGGGSSGSSGSVGSQP